MTFDLRDFANKLLHNMALVQSKPASVLKDICWKCHGTLQDDNGRCRTCGGTGYYEYEARK